jgi:hypothetical protein
MIIVQENLQALLRGSRRTNIYSRLFSDYEGSTTKSAIYRVTGEELVFCAEHLLFRSKQYEIQGYLIFLFNGKAHYRTSKRLFGL